MRVRRTLAEWAIAIAAVAVGVSVAAPVFVFQHVIADRREETCQQRQSLYDGEDAVVRLIGRELNADTARIDLAIDHLHQTTGQRPTC